MNTSNEYGSKKSVEWTLKKTAIISILVFTLCAIVYPYANKKELAVKKTISTTNIKTTINPNDVKVNWVNVKNIENKSDKGSNK